MRLSFLGLLVAVLTVAVGPDGVRGACGHATARRDGDGRIGAPVAQAYGNEAVGLTAAEMDERKQRSRARASEWDPRRHTRAFTGLVCDFVAPQPLRFVVRYLHGLTVPDPYACHQVGELVARGSPASEAVLCDRETANLGRAPVLDDCYFSCTADDLMDNDKYGRLQTHLSDATAFLSSILSVDRVQGPLVVNENADCSAESFFPVLPQSEFSTGVAGADMVLYVTNRPSPAGVLAFAVACQRDQFGRPIVGHVNWGPDQLVEGKDNALSVAIHEITHALGFSYDSFDKTFPAWPNLLDETPMDYGPHARDALRLSSPTVVDEVRAHFGCESLTGAELELGGGAGTAKSHWEKRVFANEYMTGTESGEAIYSRLTFAALADSCWYDVDFSLLDTLEYGNGLGCSFATGRCSGDEATAWTQAFPRFTCDPLVNARAEGCSSDYTSRGRCTVTEYSTALPEYFRYFDSPFLGGSSEVADFCPIIEPYTDGRCDDVDRQPSDDIFYLRGDTVTETSRCFMSGLFRERPAYEETMDAIVTACHDTKCTGDAELRVRIGYDWYTCLREGQRIRPFGFKVGHLTCPDPAILCKSRELTTDWPTFETLFPASGQIGEELTVRGTNFNANTGVQFDNVDSVSECDVIDVVTDKELRCLLQPTEQDGETRVRVYDKSSGASDLSSTTAFTVEGEKTSAAQRAEGESSGDLFGNMTGSCGAIDCLLLLIIIAVVLLLCCCLCCCGGNKQQNQKAIDSYEAPPQGARKYGQRPGGVPVDPYGADPRAAQLHQQRQMQLQMQQQQQMQQYGAQQQRYGGDPRAAAAAAQQQRGAPQSAQQARMMERQRQLRMQEQRGQNPRY